MNRTMVSASFPSVTEFVETAKHKWSGRQSLSCANSDTGLWSFVEAPTYLFRGEPFCSGAPYPETRSSLRRLENQDHSLAALLHPVVTRLVARLSERTSDTTENALGALQHYGVPTTLIDFTHDVEVALSFAAPRKACGKKGVIGVLPVRVGNHRASISFVNYARHDFCERALRQHAFGVDLRPRN